MERPEKKIRYPHKHGFTTIDLYGTDAPPQTDRDILARQPNEFSLLSPPLIIFVGGCIIFLVLLWL